MAIRNKVTGRFTRPVPGVDAESRFDPMADSVEDITNISAADVPPGLEIPRYAPAADEIASGGPWPLHRRIPVMVTPDDGGNAQGAITRAAARDSGPMDPSLALVGGFMPRAAYVAPRGQEGDSNGVPA
jgi:hypothetical protein